MNLELTKKELDILKILWANKHPMTAKDIAKIRGISSKCTSALLRSLNKRQLISRTEATEAKPVQQDSVYYYEPVMPKEKFIQKIFYSTDSPIKILEEFKIKENMSIQYQLDQIYNLTEWINETKNSIDNSYYQEHIRDGYLQCLEDLSNFLLN